MPNGFQFSAWRSLFGSPRPLVRRPVPANLRVDRLEDRRVLDAVPAGFTGTVTEQAGAVVVKAGPADGVADAFEVSAVGEGGQERLEVRAGGELVFAGSLETVRSLRIIGTDDQETLTVRVDTNLNSPLTRIDFAGGNGAGDAVDLMAGPVTSIDTHLGPEGTTLQLHQGLATFELQLGASVTRIDDGVISVARSLTSVDELTLQAGPASSRIETSTSRGVRLGFLSPQVELAVRATGVDEVLRINDFRPGDRLNLVLTADRIAVHGRVELSGGDLAVDAVRTDVTGNIDAAGGHVSLNGGWQSSLTVSGRIASTGNVATAQGGEIELMASRVSLVSGAAIDASGRAGGGVIFIGGGPDVGQGGFLADRAWVASGVTLSADALDSGSAGRIVVWSRDATSFRGTLSAKAISGDGGNAEVSSFGQIEFLGQVDLRGEAGLGTLLLDPRTVTIVDQNAGRNDSSLNAGVPDAGDPANQILFGDLAEGNLTISETALEAAQSNLLIQARDSIIIGPLSTDGVLLLQPNVSLTLQTRNDPALGDLATGGIRFANGFDRIEARGSGSIVLQAGVVATTDGTVIERAGEATVRSGFLTTAGGRLVVEATAGTAIEGSLVGGSVLIDADADDNGIGTLSTSIRAGVTSGSGGLTLLGARFDLAGTRPISAGSGELRMSSTGGRTMGLGQAGGDVQIDGALLSRTTGSRLVVGGTRNGTVTVSGLAAADVDQFAEGAQVEALQAGGRVRFTGSASLATRLTVRADAGIDVERDVTTTAGDLVLEGDADGATDGVGAGADQIVVGAGVRLTSLRGQVRLSSRTGGIEGQGDMRLEAAEGVQIDSNLQARGGLTVLADTDRDGVGTFGVGSGSVVGTTGGDITVTSAEIDLAGYLSSGVGGTIVLLPTAGRSVGLGNGAAEWRLDQGEIDRITAGLLTVGGDDSGSQVVDGVQSGGAIGGWKLLTGTAAGGGQIDFRGAGSTFTNLEATAPLGIRAEVDVSATAGNLVWIGGFGNGVGGITLMGDRRLSASGRIELRASTAAITGTGSLELAGGDGVLLGSRTTTTGRVEIDADVNRDGVGTFAITSGGSGLTTANQEVRVRSADIAIGATAGIDVGSSKITLLTDRGRTMALGGAAGDWTLEGSELRNLVASELVVGNEENGNVTVGALRLRDTQDLGLVRLEAIGSGRRITFTGGTSQFISLSARADAGIRAEQNVQATRGDLNWNGDADGTPDGNDRIEFGAGVRVSTAGSLNLAATGGLVGEGDLTLWAGSGVTLGHSLHVAGSLIVNADTNADAQGGVTSLGSVVVAGSQATLTSADIDLRGSLSVAAGTALLQTAARQGMGVGLAPGSWRFDLGEFQRTTAEQLIIGGQSTASLVVEGVSPAASQGSRSVVLRSLAPHGNVSFLGAVSTFRELQVQANEGVIALAGVTSTAGPLTIAADVDLDCMGSLTVAAGAVLDSAGHTLSVTAADLVLEGKLSSGVGDILLNPSCAIETIGVGDALANFSVSQSELSRIVNTNGTVFIGTLENLGGMRVGVDQDISLGELALVLTTGADVRVRGVLSSGTAAISLTAGRTVFLEDAARVVTVQGTIAIQAGVLPGAVRGGVDMERGAVVDGGVGFVSIAAAGNVRLAMVSTTDDVSIESREGAIINGLEQPFENVIADGLALRAALGIGDAASPITTRVVRLAGANVGAGDIVITNATDGILSITTVAGVEGIVNSGGGRIDVETDSLMTVDALVTTTPGSGGTLTIEGVVDLNVGPVVGAGDIRLAAIGGDDCALVIDTDQISATSIVLINICDIIVSARLKTTGAVADVILIADSDHDGEGGVRITASGSIESARDVIIEGARLKAAIAPTAVRIDAAGGREAVVAERNVVIRPGSAAPTGIDVQLNAPMRSLQGEIEVEAPRTLRVQTALHATDRIKLSARESVEFATTQAGLFGTTEIHADADSNGTGVFNVGTSVALQTGDRALDVRAAGIVLVGTVSTGTGGLSFSPSRGGATMGVEDASRDFRVSQGNLDRIRGTTGVVTIGSADNSAGAWMAVDRDLNPGSLRLQIVTGGAIVQGTHNVTAQSSLQLHADADGNGTGGIVTQGGRLVSPTLELRAGGGIQARTASSELTVINSTSGNNTTSGAVTIDELDALTLRQVVQSGTGGIFVTAQGELAVTLVRAQASGNVIQLTSRNSAIRNSDPIATDARVNGPTVVLSAMDGIGLQSDPLTIDAGRVIAQNSRSGVIDIRGVSANPLTLGGTAPAGGPSTASVPVRGVHNLAGDVRVAAAGAIYVVDVESLHTVSLTNLSGGIHDGLPGAGSALRAVELVLRSRGGTGLGDPLGISVQTLAATNQGGGGLQFKNTQNSSPQADSLSVGTVEGVVGLSSDAGEIGVVTSADLIVDAGIHASGGGGITLRAEGDLVLRDTGDQFDLSTDGNGRINGVAGNVVEFGPGVLLRSGRGVVPVLSPSLFNVDAPLIVASIATVTGSFGDPSGRGYIVQVDWSDGSIESRFFDFPSQFSFRHFYLQNPNIEDSSAPIPIKVTVFDDPNITLSGGNQAPITVPLTAEDTLTVAVGSQTVLTFAEVPGEGLAGAFFLLPTVSAPVSLPAPVTAIAFPDLIVPPPHESRPVPLLSAEQDESRVDSREVLLEVVDATPPVTVLLNESVLDDIPALLQKLPDGRYRIWLKEVGETRPRLLLEVLVRGGKPFDEMDLRQEAPPAAGPGGLSEGEELPNPTAASATEETQPLPLSEESDSLRDLPSPVAVATPAAAAPPAAVQHPWHARAHAALETGRGRSQTPGQRLWSRIRQQRIQD